MDDLVFVVRVNRWVATTQCCCDIDIRIAIVVMKKI